MENRILHSCRTAVLLFLCLYSGANVYAGKEKYSSAASTKTGALTPLTATQVIVTQDAQYTRYEKALVSNPSTAWYAQPSGTIPGSFYDKSIKNRVIFSIDHTDNNFSTTPYQAVISFQVTYKKYVGSAFTTVTATSQLTVTNNQASINKDKAVYEFAGGNELQVQVTAITITGSGITLSNAKLLLESEIEIERYYYFDQNAQYPTTDLTHCSADLLTKGELEMRWKTVEGAEAYELEWVYLNNYDGTKTGATYNALTSSQVTFDEKLFDFNATRISTSDNHYRIPYIYERGYILYRLRVLGREGSTGWAYNVPARWSTELSSGTITNVSLYPAANVFPLTSGGCSGSNETMLSLADNLNWQSSISYAEEGKSKAVVNFADGSLRTRQSVTKLKSKNDIIIGETVYDFQGRPAINILPVPSTAQKIAYVAGFNMYSSSAPYVADYFDYDQGSCAATAPTLYIATGASNYYSPANPVLTDENKYIPNAAGYPFTQTEYTPDNTGRIRNQGGVGPNHQLGSDHETKYLYGVPEQKDLDRLFASEVGDAVRYKKNMVIDANGQASVTYLDPSGKTIATAMAGATPTNVTSLASTGSVLTTYDLLDKSNPADNSGLDNHLDLPGKKVTLQKSILVPSNGPYTFTYALTPPKFSENCGMTVTAPPNKVITTSGNKCYTCVLDAKVSLLNECGQELFSQAFAAGINYSVVGARDTTCPGSTPAMFSKAFSPYDASNALNTAWLKTGSYTIEKSLSIDQNALDVYTRNYMDTLQNTCMLKLSDFKAAQNLAIDLSGCGMDCGACNLALGSYTNYSGPSCKICLTTAQYDSLKAECDELCSSVSDKCDNALTMLEADLNPTGQYGQYNSAGTTNSAGNVVVPTPNVSTGVSTFPLSVFNETNSLPLKTDINTIFSASGNYNPSFYTTYVYHPDWRHPYNPSTAIASTSQKKFSYLDDNGNVSYVKVVPSGSNFIPAVHALHTGNVIVDPVTGDSKVEVKYLDNLQDFLNIWETQWASSLVIYHPEYCFYEKCVIDQLSNNYDDNMTELDSIPDFNVYLNSVGTSTSSSEFMFPVGTGVGSGTVVDPYFKSGGSGYAWVSYMQNAMVNYMPVPGSPGSYISIWDMAYRIVHCPNASAGSVCSSASIPSGYTFTSSAEWQTFKGLYQSLKQSCQDTITINYSISKGGYNGCIGAEVFDPFQYNFYDPNMFTVSFNTNFFSFWGGLGWGFWPSLTLTNISQYYNPEQTCNSSKYQLYVDKSLRFPTAKMLMPDALGNVSSPCYDENQNVIPCPQSASGAINNLGNVADITGYLNCNQCPTAVNFQELLRGLATLSTTSGQKDLTNSSSPGVKLTCAPATSLHKEFTNEMAQNLFGTSPPTTDVYWKMDNSASSGTYLKGKFTYAPAADCDVYMQMPATIVPDGVPGYTTSYLPFSNPYTFANAFDFCCVKYDPTPYTFPSTSAFSGPGRFSAKVTVRTVSGDPLYNANVITYRTLVVEGYASCMDFKNCTFPPVCEASKDIKSLQNMLNALLFTSSPNITSAAIYSASAVVLTNVPYKGFLQPSLITSFDANVDPTVNNASDNWFWQFVSSSSKQLTGYFKPNTSTSSKCDVVLALNPLSSYGAGDIKKITGVTPSSVTAAPAGAFVAYALLRNSGINSNNAVWELITGTVSCLSAGKCSVQTSKDFNKDDPDDLAPLVYCPSSGCDGANFLAIFNNISVSDLLAANPSFSLSAGNTVLSGSTGTCVNGGSPCTFSIVLPADATFNFLNSGFTFVSAIPNLTLVTGGEHNHIIVNIIRGSGSSAVTPLDVYVSCIDFPVCESCTKVGNVVVNGDFEQGNTDFYSDYTNDPSSSLAYNNNSSLLLPYAASTHGKYYNVYNIKPVWTCYNNMSDHTSYLSISPTAPPTALSCSLSGNGKAMAVRAENPTLNYSVTLPGDAWYQYVNLKTGATYSFTAYFKNVEGPVTGGLAYFPSMVFQAFMNNVLVGQTVSTSNDWAKASFVFNSGSNNLGTKISIKAFCAVTSGTTFTAPTPQSDLDELFLIDDISLVGCMVGDPLTCDVPDMPADTASDDCLQNALSSALAEASYNYGFYLDTLRRGFQNRYVAKCLNAYEDFSMKCYDSENHFTLYYYDQAGNLVRTVPPQGVNRLADNATILAQIMLDRQNKTKLVFTNHTYASTYQYNSLNQLVNQDVPDNNDLNAWKTSNYSGIPSTQNVQSMAFNGSSGVLVANNGSSGFLYAYNAGSNSWAPVTNLTVSNLNDVVYVTTSTYYAVGKDGTVMKTANSGSSWNLMPFPNASAQLIKASLIPSSTEITVYDNNGNSWTSSSGLTVWTQSLNVFGFVAGEKLVDVKINAAGTSGFAISSLNRKFSFNGAAWAATTSDVKAVSLKKVTGDGSATVFAVGKDGTILRSTDNGLNWAEKVNTLNTDIIDAQFYNGSNGFLVNQSGDVYRASGSGASMTNISALTGGPGSVKAISVLNSSGILYTVDQTGNFKKYSYLFSPLWTALTSLSAGSYNCIKAVATTSVYVGGNAGVLQQFNGVSTWNSITTSPISSSENIIAIDFKVVGSGPTVGGYVLTNTGNIYQYNSSTGFTAVTGISGVYTSINALTDNSAVAVDNSGNVAVISAATATAVSTTNSNNSFKSVYVNTAGHLVAVGENAVDQAGQINSGLLSGSFVNVSTHVTPPQLFAVSVSGSSPYMSGSDGTVLKYDNTANAWNTQVTGSNTELYTVAALSSNVVASGSSNSTGTANNQLVYSSGSSWLTATNGVDDFINSQIIGSNVYFVGANKKIAKGALSPTSLSVITALPAGSSQFNGLSSDGTNIQVVGQSGLIYGGSTSSTAFSAENAFNPSNLNDVKWFDATHVIAVGNSAQIFVSDNAGVSWHSVSPGTVTGNLNAVDILSSNTAIVVGSSNEYFQVSFSCSGPTCVYTLNNSLSKPSGSGSTAYTDVSIANNNVIVVTSGGAVYYKAAAATSYTGAISSTNTNPLRSVYMVDNTFAYAVGDNGALLSINPGTSVIAVTSYGSSNLSSVYFKDYSNGYLVGAAGLMALTKNGGATWGAPPSNPSSVGTNNLNVIVANGINNSISVGGNAGATGSALDNEGQESSRFYYDKLGRLVASQNAKQYAKDPYTFSYTIYDALGRIKEVGEVKAASDIESLANTNNGQIDLTDFGTWLAAGANVFTEITRTYYDAGVTPSPSYDGAGTFTQDAFCMRNRVAYTTYQDVAGTTFNQATYYNYDIHGNVKSLYQYNSDLPTGNKYKRTDYDYDLISGKVNMVSYQAGAADQFYHKYYYDDDNRITNVYTSKDNSIWDQDAKYFYYRHGPVAHVETGQNKVQATDYAYTLQGWLKGINSNKLDANNDIGNDGLPINGNSINSFISRDAMAYSLGYYKNDYAAVIQGSTSAIATSAYFLADATGSTIESNNKNMFNGNISNMTKSIGTFMVATSGQPQNYMYQYDQLNRLVEAVSFESYNTSTNAWNSTAVNNKYKEYLSYDANGNIQTLKRYDNAGGVMDSLSYKYLTVANGLLKNSNKLGAVLDATTTAIADDVESGQVFNTGNHSLDNYQYDNIGNLIKDSQEEIANIDWTVYGKIKQITRTSASTKPDLVYNYDASGNRISKIAKTKSSPGTFKNPNLWTYTYYQRDAQGNVMAVYEKNAGNSNTLYLIEQHLYGSNRLGVLARSQNMQATWTPNGISDRDAGNKSFELSNHLGNVLTTVTDRKIPVDDGVYNTSGTKTSSTPDGTLDYFTADVISATDYYAFGSPMPTRQYNNGTYRYGFNGKENDNEVKGIGNQQDYGMRIYDPRIGKFLSVDPLSKQYSWNSTYAFAENDVIRSIDLDGGEKKIVIHYTAGFHKDGSPNIVKTSVDINMNLVIKNPLTGKDGAATYVFYYNSEDGSFSQGETLYEAYDDHEDLKPSASYDYTKDNNSEKAKDDIQYLKKHWVLGPDYLQYRDEDAPDNYSTLDDLSGVDASLVVIGSIGGTSKSPTLIKSIQTKKGDIKSDYLMKNSSEAMNWGREKLGHNTKKIYNDKGQLIKIENEKGDYLFFNHGDWGKGKGSSTFPHINFKIGNTQGHLFLENKIINRKQLDDFLKYFADEITK